jgi:hypothetical protein
MSLISKIFGKKIEPELLQGFYRDVIPLNDIESSTQSDYEYIAYISEIERYKNTSEIEWLVSENELKTERKEKLDEINNKNFIQRLFSK